jgi:hypothetical protein
VRWLGLISLIIAFIPLAQAAQLPENCVSLVGDSVSHGEVVYMVPGHGFGILRTTPLSIILQETLDERDIELEVRDRSAPAAFLSSEGKNPYFETEAYEALLEDRCRFTVVMPWINDLSIERLEPLEAHVADLAEFAETLHKGNPEGQVLILGFYYGEPSEFAAEHAPGYTDGNLLVMNLLLKQACLADEVLGSIPNVVCLSTEDLFTDPENSHVALGITQADLETLLYEPIPEDVRPFFEVYWRDNPTGEVYGDGVHLSESGKLILTNALVDEFLRLEPDL